MRAPGARPADRADPRHVAVDDQHHVRARQRLVLPPLVPLHALVAGMRRRKVHVVRNGLEHADRRARSASADQLADAAARAPDIGGDDQRTLGRRQRAGDLARRIRVEAARRHRPPLPRIDAHARHFALEHFARRRHVHRPARLAVRELQRAMHDLLGVRADADFVFVAHVAAHQATLIRHVLDPLDELVAAAARLAFLRGGRHAGDDEHGHPALRGVVHGAAERLRAAVHVHQHGLRAARGLRVAVGRGHRDHFRRGRDDFGTGPVRGARLRQWLR